MAKKNIIKKTLKKIKETKAKIIPKIKNLKKDLVILKKNSKKTALILDKKAKEVIGEVTHYYPKVKAAVIKFKRPLAVGAEIMIEGATTNFKQIVTSIEYNHKKLKEAKPKFSVGILVKRRVRIGDKIHRIKK